MAVIFRVEPLLRLANHQCGLRCGQQLAPFLQSQSQLLQIVVNPIKDRNANRFGSQF
jgi:hypothetical protein